MFESITTFSLILYLIGALLIAMLATLIWILVYSGLFDSLDDIGTGQPPLGQTVIAYKYQEGPYNEAGQVFTEAAIISPKNKAIGIYYDDPEKVQSSKLRYVVGSILSEGSKEIDDKEVKEFTKEGFKILHLPEVDFAVRTKFPHKTSLSILIAISKAYPLMRLYIEEHKLCAYPFLELYDGQNIHFMAPLSKQDHFYVPECEKEALGGEQMTEEFESTVNASHSTNGGDCDISNSDLSQDLSQSIASSLAGKEEEEQSLMDTTEGNVSVMEGSRNNRQFEVHGDGSHMMVGEALVHMGSSRAGTEDRGEGSEEDSAALSDASTSSFEVVKTDKDEF